jgi:hypothetical protein
MSYRGTFRLLALVLIRTALAVAIAFGLFSTVLPLASGPVTWSGALSFPAGYTIGDGVTVQLDPDADTTVTLGGNLVVEGVLSSKPASGVTHTIRFTGIQEESFVGGGNEPLASDVGLWVTGSGRLDLAGDEKLAWTRASAGLSPGATSAALEAPASAWHPGDEVLIAPTEDPTAPGFSANHEVRTLTWVSGSTIGFAPLSHPHPRVTVKPGAAYGAEIVNLTRSVRIEGQDATHRSHVWIKSGVPQSIRNVSIRFMGPQKGAPKDVVLGRYGLHFHRMGEDARGSLVEGVVVRGTGGPAFAVHASNGVTLKNTIAFDIQGAAYWYDPGATEAPNDATYDGALAGLVRPTPKQGQGFRLTAFLLGRGTGNGCLRCVAFGVQGGKNSSGFGWPEGEIGVWRFEDSLAHNNARNGIFVWQNNTSGHFNERFTAYHNGFAGIEHGAYSNGYHYRENVLYGNKTAAVYLHAESQTAPPPLSFEHPYIDGAGITQNAVLLAKPVLINLPPAVWCGATIEDLKGPEFLVEYGGPDATLVERLLILPVCPAVLPSLPVPPDVTPGVPPLPKPPPKRGTSPTTGPSPQVPGTPAPPSPSPSPGRTGGPPPKRGG